MFGRRASDPLQGVDLGLGKGDAVLASCPASDGAVLVASSHRLSVVGADGAVQLQRPWHLVDTGRYDNEADVLTVTWVDRAPDLPLHVGGHRPFLQAFRERVQATVVIAEQIDLPASRQARVVIRKNLAENRLLDQVILGPGVRLAAPGVRDRIEVVRRALREQVGLP
ncbi:MAG TPA: hypothetical protein GXZ60_16270 [Intrasporangiaceae bacterium]|nr:hypothetical protein [Intrasporangiaceae bacterium]